MISSQFLSDRLRDQLPQPLHGFITWLTALPVSQTNPSHRSALKYLVQVFLLLFMGMGISSLGLILRSGWWLLLIPGWMLTVSAARQMQVVVVHHCAHFNFTRNRALDRSIGRLISALFLFRDFDEYVVDHRQHHCDPIQPQDETIRFLQVLVGLKPGTVKHLLHRQIWLSLFSPVFHGRFLWARLNSSLVTSSPIHSVCSWLFLLIEGIFVTVFHLWFEYGLVWLIPITILYQVSTCLRLCSEHVQPKWETDRKRDKTYFGRATLGIFLVSELPNSGLEWFGWWCNIFLVQLPLRVFVLVGDTPCHDYHHRHPGADDWLNCIWARQADIDRGCPGWSEPYGEVVGFFQAIDRVMDSISQTSTLSLPQSIYGIKVYRSEHLSDTL